LLLCRQRHGDPNQQSNGRTIEEPAQGAQKSADGRAEQTKYAIRQKLAAIASRFFVQ
jgi:hypothetical protein